MAPFSLDGSTAAPEGVAFSMSTPERKVCTTCGKGPVRARGLCAAHYSQQRRKEQHEKKTAPGANSHLRADTNVKREGTPKGKGPSPREKKVARTLGGLLTLANTVALQPFTPTGFPLTEPEVDLLAKTGAPVVLESKTLTAWVEKLDGAGGPKVQFAAAVLVVALPRAVQAGLVPAEQAQGVFQVALTIALADPDEFEEPAEEGEPNRGPAPVDTGATVEVEAHVGSLV